MTYDQIQSQANHLKAVYEAQIQSFIDTLPKGKAKVTVEKQQYSTKQLYTKIYYVEYTFKDGTVQPSVSRLTPKGRKTENDPNNELANFLRGGTIKEIIFE